MQMEQSTKYSRWHFGEGQLLMFEHAIANHQHLAHGSGQGHHFAFASRYQPLLMNFDYGVPLHGYHCSGWDEAKKLNAIALRDWFAWM